MNLHAECGVEFREPAPVAVDAEPGHDPDHLAQEVDDGRAVVEHGARPLLAEVGHGQTGRRSHLREPMATAATHFLPYLIAGRTVSLSITRDDKAAMPRHVLLRASEDGRERRGLETV